MNFAEWLQLNEDGYINFPNPITINVHGEDAEVARIDLRFEKWAADATRGEPMSRVDAPKLNIPLPDGRWIVAIENKDLWGHHYLGAISDKPHPEGDDVLWVRKNWQDSALFIGTDGGYVGDEVPQLRQARSWVG